jgi:anti-sigma factor RsiW
MIFMRCARAQRWMAAAIDGELSPRHRRVLDQHVAGCAPCAREMAATQRLLTALSALPLEAAVPARVEYATMRRVRGEVTAGGERRSIWATLRARWFGWAVPAFAAAAVLMIAITSTLRSSPPTPPVTVHNAPVRSAKKATPHMVASAPHETGQAGGPAAGDLAEAPDLFVDLPILRNMEKLQHFETIRTTTLDDDVGAPGQEPQSNG